MKMQTTPTKIYTILFSHFGKQDWWPMDKTYHKKHNSDPRFEVIIGSILTQNTAWSNVEKAIENLKKETMLSIKKINDIDCFTLKTLIKPSGFFNQKALRLKIISRFIQKAYNGNLDDMFSQSYQFLRKDLLSLNGIGPETADSILLYAGCKPVFVVDAYTKRLCSRLSLQVNVASYEAIQQYFQKDLSNHNGHEIIVSIYNEYHAVIVEWAKQYCLKRNPRCKNCPLRMLCIYRQTIN